MTITSQYFSLPNLKMHALTAGPEDGRLVKYPPATHWIVDELPTKVSQELLRHFGGE